MWSMTGGMPEQIVILNAILRLDFDNCISISLVLSLEPRQHFQIIVKSNDLPMLIS